MAECDGCAELRRELDILKATLGVPVDPARQMSLPGVVERLLCFLSPTEEALVWQRSRKRSAVLVRAQVALAARALGASQQDVARALDLHHTTVRYYFRAYGQHPVVSAQAEALADRIRSDYRRSACAHRLG